MGKKARPGVFKVSSTYKSTIDSTIAAVKETYPNARVVVTEKKRGKFFTARIEVHEQKEE